ncbi:MAG TPA: hypothetical protein VGH64_09025 [Puia sp.]|jgi:hypothetical protein
MHRKELLEKIEMVAREEEMKKKALESDFSMFGKQMMPVAIVKRGLKNGISKIKSLLPHLPKRSNAGHA